MKHLDTFLKIHCNTFWKKKISEAGYICNAICATNFPCQNVFLAENCTFWHKKLDEIIARIESRWLSERPIQVVDSGDLGSYELHGANVEPMEEFKYLHDIVRLTVDVVAMNVSPTNVGKCLKL
ncbi:hypothetical protein QTP88_002028 [Uroleucon formosanum]